ncbi:MAG: carbohydrate binding domain-containing protein [Planctomycetota bacterium]
MRTPPVPLRLVAAAAAVAAAICLVAPVGPACAADQPLDLPAAGQPLPYRWVYIERSLSRNEDVTAIAALLKRAAAHGFNGMVFASQLVSLDLEPPAFFTRLDAVKKIAAQLHIAIVPLIFSAGYGNAILHHDRNLAEGFLVKDQPFDVKNGEAHPLPDPNLALPDGGLEDWKKDEARGWTFQDDPGVVSFRDDKIFHGGQSSLRFEHFEKDKRGRGRLFQDLTVTPHRCYVLSFWVKTKDLAPAGNFEVGATGEDGRELIYADTPVAATQDWQVMRIVFNSGEAKKINLHIGGEGFKSGAFWLDDIAIEEPGLVNFLRRPGTPLTVKNAQDGTVYTEGRDFEPLRDTDLSFKPDHKAIPIILTKDSRIPDGAKLLVSFYHGLRLKKGQVSICMSEPAVYRIWATQAKLLKEHLGCNTFMLDMDEIRECGTCQADADRKISQAEQLGDCITQQVAILRKEVPGCMVLCWSDMLDPNQNCRNRYFMTAGDYTGAWKYVPKDLVIVCWDEDIAAKSLAHFSSLGMHTFAAAYYDADDLAGTRDWLAALRKTPGAEGIIYTTWEDRYKLLEDFGDLVSK